MEGTFLDQDSLYFLLEIADRGDLSTLIMMHDQKPFDRKVAQFLLAEIVMALEAMSSKDIAHRDLKPANILLNKKMTQEEKKALKNVGRWICNKLLWFLIIEQEKWNS